ncbi:hypothetical protein [Novosphingobium sp.]|uniref:hypothetical protein n=1 Tax=Novosphingobium sp. TaxID=1874826 RepID=UPI00286D99EE|nr:hypothetical protein [Novosphingobium sp.]
MTIDELADASPGVLDKLPIAVLANLQNEADRHLASAQQMQAILHGVLVRRYAAGLNDTGTHHRTDGDFDIKVTVPKTVSWDQPRLASAIATIRDEWEGDPAEYVETKLSIMERKFDAWPAPIRDLFAPARTVKAGKPKIEIALRDEKREAA